MKRHGKILAGVLAGLAVATGARAVPEPENPYHTIPERNVFRLNARSEAPAAAPAIIPLPRITLTGITTILGGKRALLTVQAAAREGAAPREESYILAEGQREGDVEVLEIDEQAGTVRVNTGGTTLTIDFKNNGAKQPTATAEAPAPEPHTAPTAAPQPAALPPQPNPAPGQSPPPR